MIRIRKKTSHRQRGAVLVEMVLVTPLLLAMMVLTAEITRAFVDHNTLTKAVRNGARHVSDNALQGTTGNVALTAAVSAEARWGVQRELVAHRMAALSPGLAP